MSDKYPRIPHFPFSPGTTREDRINYYYWEEIGDEVLILTEKLDGENTCLNRHGVFARSHSMPTKNPWTDYLKSIWSAIRNDLGDLEIFGENLYAVHSIEYTGLEAYFYVFGIREKDRWLSWEDVNFYAQFFGFPIVPIISSKVRPTDKKQFEESIVEYSTKPSSLGGEREGLVIRVEREFYDSDFENCIFKWVRPHHVKTNEHWTKDWRRARLK